MEHVVPVMTNRSVRRRGVGASREAIGQAFETHRDGAGKNRVPHPKFSEFRFAREILAAFYKERERERERELILLFYI